MNPIDNNSPFNGPLTPHHFRNNSNNNNENSQQAKTTSKTSPIRYAPLVIAGLALLVLPITVWQINTQQDIRQRASEQQVQQPSQQNIVATVGDIQITDADIDEEYTKQQNATSYTVAPTSLREQVLNDILRKLVIQDEANERGITISDEEINEKINILNSLNSSLASNREIVRDLVLEEKVSAAISGSKIVNLAFSNDDTPQSESFFEIIRNEAIDTESLVGATTPYTRRSKDVTLFESITLVKNSHFLTDENSESVFNLEDGEISELIINDGRIFLIEIVSTDNDGSNDFEEFIQEKISSMVRR